MKKKRKRTPEERAAEQARRDDLTRRLQEAIAHYRGLAERRRTSSEPETASSPAKIVHT